MTLKKVQHLEMDDCFTHESGYTRQVLKKEVKIGHNGHVEAIVLEGDGWRDTYHNPYQTDFWIDVHDAE